MRPILLAAALTAGVLLNACSKGSESSYADMGLRDVTLPGGQIIRAEVMTTTLDLMRGMMFRTSLAPDHGMLYIQPTPGKHSYWTYQTLIPLDIIWMDAGRNIVEMVENAPPCKTQASQCPQYGGAKVAKYVLELSGGMARKYSLSVGQKIEF